MRAIPLLILVLLPVTAWSQQVPLLDVKVEYRLPVDQLNLPNTSEKWKYRAPTIGEFQDPNQIAYDEGYIVQHLRESGKKRSSKADFSVADESGQKIYFGYGILGLGNKFKQQDLLRFVQSRIDAKTIVKQFNVRARIFVARNETYTPPKRSPWTRNIVDAITVLGLANCEDAKDMLIYLAENDDDEWVRNASFTALGRLSAVQPAIQKELNRIGKINKDFAINVREAYRIANNVGPNAAGMAVIYLRSSKPSPRKRIGKTSLQLLERVHYSSCAAGFHRNLNSSQSNVRDAAIWGLTKVKLTDRRPMRLSILDQLQSLREQLGAGELEPSPKFKREELNQLLETAIERFEESTD